MPDIDTLMQEWPGEVEELLKEINLPSAALQVELPQYVDLICSKFSKFNEKYLKFLKLKLIL